MLKKDIRLNFSKLRTRISPEELLSISEAILNGVMELPIWDAHYYHIFLPIIEKNEVDSGPLVKFLRRQEKKIVVPKVRDEFELDHFLLTDNTQLVTNRWGIQEPVDADAVSPQLIDVIFLPLLAFDLQGHRVGYGRGYYDRFISTSRDDVITVGISAFDPVDTITDVHEKDVVMNYAVTPSRTYSF